MEGTPRSPISTIRLSARKEPGVRHCQPGARLEFAFALQGGFPSWFPLRSQAVLKMPPHLRSWQPDRVGQHSFPRKQGGSYGCTTALSRTNLGPASNRSWRTAKHQCPSATRHKTQWVMVKPVGGKTPTGKTSDYVFLRKATKGYVMHNHIPAALYVLQGPNDFTLM